MLINILGEDNRTLVASNKSLKDMIEEFSQNVTLNLMTDDYFSLREITVYTYEPRNLVIAYGIAILSSFFTVCIGVYALRSNGVTYDLSVSTVICTTQNDDVSPSLTVLMV
ncbi:hypothetical protein SLS58_004454 [Diplodia intermedia]|uniref:Uncharacterized protein n=1 Tax=Diplodia intermedia TaxID=856260 RepID=A0ABR3TTD5_9PEZI